MQKIAAFDLEIAKTLPEDSFDWKSFRPLGIICAGIKAAGPNRRKDDFGITWGKSLQLSPVGCQDIVHKMQWLVERGYVLVTVNGAGFDFDVLAEESGLWSECADLALHHHCDLMLVSVCRFGWRTGLAAFADGAGVESKLKAVTLNDGSVLSDMNGARAPELWAAGEHNAVYAYLEQDVEATLQAALTALRKRKIGWYSASGRWYEEPLFEIEGEYKLPTVAQCLRWPEPDTSWMHDPPDPHQICEWATAELEGGS